MNSKMNRRAGLAFLMPALVVVLLVTVLPVISVVNYSFHEWIVTDTPDGPSEFVGVQNYADALSDPQFHNSVWVTIIYTAFTTGMSIALGLVIAVYIQRGGRWTNIIKTVLIFPFAISLVVRGYSFRFFLLEDGVIDTVLDSLLWFDETVWLNDTWWARFWIAVPIVWSWGPMSGLMMTGAINNISPELFEAARVDGASSRQTFFLITLPLLRPMILVSSLLVTLFAVRMFDLIPTMTFGGPGRDTEIINYFIWRKGFSEWNMGYASALAILLTIVLIAFSYLYARIVLPNDAEGAA